MKFIGLFVCQVNTTLNMIVNRDTIKNKESREMYNTIIEIVGSHIVNLLGGWTSAMTTLIIFMTVDFGTDLIVSVFFNKNANSDTSGHFFTMNLKRLIKKIVILAVVVVAYRLDLLINVNYIRNATIIGFCVIELISIFKNAGLMGLKMPTAITKTINILNSKQEDKHEDN